MTVAQDLHASIVTSRLVFDIAPQASWRRRVISVSVIFTRDWTRPTKKGPALTIKMTTATAFVLVVPLYLAVVALLP
jgi:hypothetical protein